MLTAIQIYHLNIRHFYFTDGITGEFIYENVIAFHGNSIEVNRYYSLLLSHHRFKTFLIIPYSL